MKKIQSLILLVGSLSKPEKKAISLNSSLTKGDKNYVELFNLIEKGNITDPFLLQDEYSKSSPKSTFHPVANYLYNYILDIILKLKINNNYDFQLYNDFLKIKILYERNLDSEFRNALNDLEVRCKELNNFNLLLIIKSLEIKVFRENYYSISEDELYKKLYEMTETIKILRQINEQESLYELMMHRIMNASSDNAGLTKERLNDLVVSEISLNSNLKINILDIKRNHLLFQAQYLIFTGDYNSALNTFIELDNLYLQNKNLWDNPPYSYLNIIEGILSSLREIKHYNEMEYFIHKLEDLEYSSFSFTLEKRCIIFIYSLIRLLDYREMAEALYLYKDSFESCISKLNLLPPYRQMQLSLHLSILFLQNKEFEKARKQITKIINGKVYDELRLYKPIQLINLVIHYELNDYEIITSRIRAIKRKNKIENRLSNVENLLLYFLEIDIRDLSAKKSSSLANKIKETFKDIQQNPLETSLTMYFDFEKWMLDKLIK